MITKDETITDLITKEAYCEEHNLNYEGIYLIHNDISILTSRCDLCEEIFNIERKKDEDQEIKLKNDENALKLLNTFEKSNIPLRYREKDFDNYVCDNDENKLNALKLIKSYYNEITNNKLKLGEALILCGKVGTGKTHLACAIANDLIYKKIGTVFFATAYEIISIIRETYRKDSKKSTYEVMKELKEYDLLIIDEVGVQRGTEDEQMLLFDIINSRYSYLKSIILISNLNITGIETFLGERVIDRMKENNGILINLNWNSYR